MKDNNMKDNNEDINNALDNIRNFDGEKYVEKKEEEDPKAIRLGVLSLVIGVGINAVIALLSGGGDYRLSFPFTYILLLMYFPHNVLFVIGAVLMVICRIKYKSSKFGKVIMWIYIIQAPMVFRIWGMMIFSLLISIMNKIREMILLII